ncbi:MAG: uncharacterized protein QOI51_2502 [Nocardioidaceae bacterium]|nr:uncharacterized protein [Nocardioidaceae bacterium]MDX6308954.1 uncharacterized protein [Nocardioidaceae bacterium]
MKLDPVLLEILVCPDCKGSLTVDQDHDELICNSCGLIYPVRDDIPIMLVEEARRPEPPAASGGPTDVPAADVPAGDAPSSSGPTEPS